MPAELKWNNSVSTVQDDSGQWLIKLDEGSEWNGMYRVPTLGDKCILWDCFSARERMRGTFEQCKEFAAAHTKQPTKMDGAPVSEDHVAKALGFKDVYEFRRWETETGKENAELKHALQQAKDEALRFRWSGMRSHAILERCKTFLESVRDAVQAGDSRQLKEAVGMCDIGDDGAHIEKLLLGCRVILGGSGADSVDWNHELADWLDYLNPLRIKIEGEECVVTGILDGDSRTRRTLETDLATFTGPKLRVTADHVGLVSGGLEAWIANVPKTCRITYTNSQLGMNIYYGSDKPYETADFENPEDWGLEPPEKLPDYTCMVKPPPEK